MKIFVCLLVFTFTLNEGLAQHKTLTLYYPNDSTHVISITNLDSMSVFICGASKVNYGGKAYNTVLIGNQCWLRENLDIGTMASPSNNGAIEKYCYNNLPANCETYGGLYLWDEAMQYVTTEGAQGICPDGWHMPTEAEYQSLVTYVSNDANALKREDQGSGSGQGTNTSGFSALLAGAKGYSGGPFQGLGEWSSFYAGKIGSCGYSCVYSMGIVYNTSTITFGEGAMPSWGFSVRCIKD